MEKEKKSNIFVTVFDILFVMILCFVTLLTTMLMRGAVIVGSGGGGMNYSFSIVTFGATLLAMGVYLFYMLPRSDKELRQMIKNSYDGRDENN